MKPIMMDATTAFNLVYYPYRKSPDVYISLGGTTARCIQCAEDVQLVELVNHIRAHDRRKGPAPIIAATGRDDNGKINLVEVESFSDKAHGEMPE